MTPEELAAAAGGPLNQVGAVYYFHPDTVARSKELGLDGFRFYVLGRGGAMGDVQGTVVKSAFGYFHPELVLKMWNSAREVVAPADACAAQLECAYAIGRTEFKGLEGLDAFNEAAEAVIAATALDGLTLYAGYAALPLPDDAEARAMHLAITLRELRGSAHLAAVIASGLSAPMAHAIKRPDMVAGFGWEEAPVIEEHHRRALNDAEAMTDRILGPSFAALSDAQADALLTGADAMLAALSDD